LLFSCTPDGAKVSSVSYSIIETAKENGLQPYYYIKFLLETLPDNGADRDIENFLPWSYSLPACCFLLVKSSNNDT